MRRLISVTTATTENASFYHRTTDPCTNVLISNQTATSVQNIQHGVGGGGGGGSCRYYTTPGKAEGTLGKHRRTTNNEQPPFIFPPYPEQQHDHTTVIPTHTQHASRITSRASSRVKKKCPKRHYNQLNGWYNPITRTKSSYSAINIMDTTPSY